MGEEDKGLHKNPVPRLAGRYIRWTAYGLLILLFSLIQSLPHGLPRIAGVLPVLMVPLTGCIAMQVGPVGGAVAGAAAGFLWDLYASSRLLGFNALLLLIIGCFSGLLVRLLIRNNLLSALLLVTGSLLVQGLSDWCFNFVLFKEEELLFLLLYDVLPAMAYTLVLSPLVYGLVYGITRILRNRE